MVSSVSGRHQPWERERCAKNSTVCGHFGVIGTPVWVVCHPKVSPFAPLQYAGEAWEENTNIAKELEVVLMRS